MLRIKSIGAGIIDLLESFSLLILMVLSVPYRICRRLDGLVNIFGLAKTLLPRGLFAAFIRSRLDQRLGNLDQSISILNYIIGALEEEKSALTKDSEIYRWLLYLYGVALKAQIDRGRLEEAAMLLVRANSNLNVNYLNHMPELDVKAAHILKAGIAASKLLNDNKACSIVVAPEKEPSASIKSSRRGATTAKKPGGKVIPFPTPIRT